MPPTPDPTTIADLMPDPRNARQHSPRNVALIANSLHEVGAARSIVIDEDGLILAGNATVEAAAEAGIERVQVVDADGETIVAVRRRGLTAEQKARLALLDNRTAELAGWDAAQLLALAEEGVPLGDLWRDDEWAEILAQAKAGDAEPPEDPGPQLDKAEELREKWGCQPGQLWEIPSKSVPGKCHRLLCGDSTKAEDVARLMGGERADTCVSDPPYGMNWDADASRFSGGKFGHHPRGRERDDVINDDKPFDPTPFLAYPVVVLFGMNHFCDKLPPGGVLVWIKKPDDRFGTFLSDCELAWTNTGHGVYAFRHEWGGITRESERGEFLHPTQKPAALLVWAMEKSKAGKAIYDPFLGAGATMVATEQTGRIAFGCDIEPRYIAVSLQRLADLGLEPRLVSE